MSSLELLTWDSLVINVLVRVNPEMTKRLNGFSNIRIPRMLSDSILSSFATRNNTKS